MKKAIVGMVGLLLAVSVAGCSADATPEPGEESVATTHEALYYSHVWNVFTLVNGARTNYYPPDDVSLLTGLGFPLEMWDSGSSPSTNSGNICARLPLAGGSGSGWYCIWSSNFAGANYIHTAGGGSNYPKDIQVTKPINSGNWTAQWGTGGPGYSYIYYASYGT